MAIDQRLNVSAIRADPADDLYAMPSLAVENAGERQSGGLPAIIAGLSMDQLVKRRVET
jgi:hypothetical protein